MPNSISLVLKSGPAAGKEFPLDKPEMFIGRDLANDIVINDAEVSRRHARLYQQNNFYVLEDLGSTNGSSVGGQRLTGPYLLRPGDKITFGERVNLSVESALAVSLPQTAGLGQPSTQPPPSSAPAVSSYSTQQPVAPIPNQAFTPPNLQQPVINQPPGQAPMQPPTQQPAAYPPSYDPYPSPYQSQPPAIYSNQEPALPVSYNEVAPQVNNFKPIIQYRIPIWIYAVLAVLVIAVIILMIDDFRLWCPLFRIC